MSGTGFTFSSAGLTPKTPAELYAELLALVATLAPPGYTARLPGSLIDDISGTDVGAIALADQAAVETVASLTPLSANPWLLTQLAQIYLGQGSTAAAPSNTSVYVVFTGDVGFPIGPGFIVSDGTNQYAVQEGGGIESGGSSAPIFCLATQPGSWAVPANTVTTLATSVPLSVTLSVTNPLAGTPGGEAETEAEFRVRVLQAGLVASNGMPAMLKTRLGEVAGVQERLISVRQKSPGWEVIVGGNGDPYAVAYAIFFGGLFDVSSLVGSTLAVTGITNANPGVMTTDLNHGFATGQIIGVTGVVGMSGINGTPLTITVITEKTFSLGINTTGSGAWTSGGVVTPNFRNTSVNINSYPDVYTIPFVVPPVQAVTMAVTWNTISTNFVNPVAVAQLSQPALAAYINGVQVGAVINVFQMEEIFQESIVSILPRELLTRLVFSVSINGIVTAPASGTFAISGDPESYFSTTTTDIAVLQG